MTKDCHIKIFLFAIFLLLLLPGCRQPEFASTGRQDDILVDGKPEDWQRVSTYHLEEPPLGIALCNDQEFLYLRLTTHDLQLQQQIRRGGLTIWLDPSGKKEKSFGISFPLAQNAPPSGDGRPEQGTEPQMSKNSRDKRPQQNNDRFELLVGEKILGDFSVFKNRFAISLALGTQQAGLIYELKIPLSANKLFLQAIPPSATLGIGLETKQTQMSAGPSERAQQSGGEERGGRGGMSGGPGGMKKSGGSEQSSLKFWFKTHLAAGTLHKGPGHD
ncbi:hypothetical protein SAMN05660420_01793 [Desulfuromusa kysingii]|uniref:Uncharacterized protein n=1 Tax=Desulfuromusa kysingii TaxID=37625 RepID=A0A1H4A3V8_9BACT|nr:hypothetical protein [Desulfuromusa kysingii]SEA30685.1 hypothetical protein SAMN05660420_01793 [Desulfuromusa kysingii]